jgi:hypothetical protein
MSEVRLGERARSQSAERNFSTSGQAAGPGRGVLGLVDVLVMVSPIVVSKFWRLETPCDRHVDGGFEIPHTTGQATLGSGD